MSSGRLSPDDIAYSDEKSVYLIIRGVAGTTGTNKASSVWNGKVLQGIRGIEVPVRYEHAMISREPSSQICG